MLPDLGHPHSAGTIAEVVSQFYVERRSFPYSYYLGSGGQASGEEAADQRNPKVLPFLVLLRAA